MGKRLGNSNKRLSVYKRGVRGIVFLAFEKASGRKAEEFFDNLIVQELVDEGFVNQLSKLPR